MNTNRNYLFLRKIIEEQNLCITKNPKGFDKLWPKSYIKFFYSSPIFYKYKFLKAINLLEFNCNNESSINLWKNYFKKIKIRKKSIDEIGKITNKYNNFFDILILNQNEKYQINFNHILRILSLANDKGIIIIENCGMQFNTILKIYIKLIFKYDVVIEDYRMDRFLVNNCILYIRKKGFLNKSKIISFLKLIYYLILELIIKIIIALKFMIRKIKF